MCDLRHRNPCSAEKGWMDENLRLLADDRILGRGGRGFPADST
jgi:hypothetical protein